MAEKKSREVANSKGRRYAIFTVAAAAVVVIASLVAYSQLRNTGSTTSATASTAASATTTSAANSSTTAATTNTTSAVQAGFGAVPASFSPSSASFISNSDGFVLGGIPCNSSATKYCAVLAVTTNTGASWTANPLSGIPLTTRGFFASNTTAGTTSGAAEIRFANASVGYAFDPGLYVTSNGGASFSPVSVPGISGIGTTEAVTSLEIANGNVTATVAPHQGPSPTTSGNAELISANIAVSPSSFSIVTAPAQLSYEAIYFQNSAGQLITIPQAAAPSAYYAAPGSTAWQGITPPCVSSHLGNGSIFAIGSLFATEASAPSDGIAMGCTLGVAAGSSQKEIDISSNTGASWEVLPSPPLGGDMSAVAAGSANNISVAAESGASFIYSTSNAGKTWTTFSFPNNPLGTGGVPIFDLGYTNPTQAFAILGWPGSAVSGQLQSSFYLTTNAGSTWTQIAF